MLRFVCKLHVTKRKRGTGSTKTIERNHMLYAHCNTPQASTHAGNDDLLFSPLHTFCFMRAGEYAEGKRSGEGLLLAPDGGAYYGAFAADAFEGTGTYEYPDGSCYVGGWAAGQKHGDGARCALLPPCCVVADAANAVVLGRAAEEPRLHGGSRAR